MNTVTILSIERSQPHTSIRIAFQIDGVRHDCHMFEIPGSTGLGFDDQFDQLFTRTLFSRAIGALVERTLRHEALQFPITLTEQSVAHQFATR